MPPTRPSRTGLAGTARILRAEDMRGLIFAAIAAVALLGYAPTAAAGSSKSVQGKHQSNGHWQKCHHCYKSGVKS